MYVGAARQPGRCGRHALARRHPRGQSRRAVADVDAYQRAIKSGGGKAVLLLIKRTTTPSSCRSNRRARRCTAAGKRRAQRRGRPGAFGRDEARAQNSAVRRLRRPAFRLAAGDLRIPELLPCAAERSRHALFWQALEYPFANLLGLLLSSIRARASTTSASSSAWRASTTIASPRARSPRAASIRCDQKKHRLTVFLHSFAYPYSGFPGRGGRNDAAAAQHGARDARSARR